MLQKALHRGKQRPDFEQNLSACLQSNESKKNKSCFEVREGNPDQGYHKQGLQRQEGVWHTNPKKGFVY